MTMTSRTTLLPLLFALLISSAMGQPECSPFFSDHMVIQRGMPIHLDGHAAPDGPVTAELRSLDESFTTTTQTDSTGHFVVAFPELPAGGPYEITITDADGAVTLHDIMIGDLWICSGQSNMAWSLSQADGGAAAIEHSYNPHLRLFTVPPAQSMTPSEDVVGGPWHRSSPDSTPDFSAVGYFFGRELQERSGVPIGLINSSWGGTQIQPWTHADAYPNSDGLDYIVEPTSSSAHPTPTGLAPVDEARLNALLKTLPKAKTVKPYNALIRSSANPTRPGQIYNAMIHPLTRYPIRGVIWYQGESNASRAVEYRRLFPLMIQDWRKRWDQPDLPFLFVQLANYMARMTSPQESDWAALREAQLMTLDLPHTGMAVTIDIGEADDIHPRNKLDVGLRLARHALAQCYQIETGPVDGPFLDTVSTSGDELTLTFSSAPGGLELREPVAGTFAIATEDGPFQWANVRLDEETIVLSAPEVRHPAQVRYAWADNPPSPLYNESGLPASPFRTDDRPLPSAGRRSGPVMNASDASTREELLESQDWTETENARIAVSSFQEGNPIQGAIDGDPLTRWSSEELGALLLADLGDRATCREVALQLFWGDRRQSIFRIETSVDGIEWHEVFYGTSSGQSVGEERFPVSSEPVRYVLMTFYGNSDSLWNSVNEIRFIP